MIRLTRENFEKVVKENKNVLIDFYADWCGPCKMIAPILEELDKEANDLTICKVNVDEEGALAMSFKVEYIPMLVVIKDGEIKASSSGMKSKNEILEMLK